MVIKHIQVPMFQNLIRFSVRNRLLVGFLTLVLLLGGLYAMFTLPVDAVPDITNNQVQIVTVSPTLSPQEVEQLITMPIEISMSNIMNVEEIRSVSRFGLSLVTVVFKESVPTLDARQLINEQIQAVSEDIPSQLGHPELMPITTGLGEIYQYVLRVRKGYEHQYDDMELRTIQDWIVRRQLSGIPGIVEINSFGGHLKQYEVALNAQALSAFDITVSDVLDALERNNQNTGASYIEKQNRSYYIRSEGMIQSLSDIGDIVIDNRNGIPVHVDEVATVRLGSPKRFGAMTMDGEGECVGGIAMMLKGANASQVTRILEERIQKVQGMLPEGVYIEPYLNRSNLVSRNITTVARNLIEGALIVFLVLMVFLGNARAGMIIASVVPLAMFFGFIMMRIFNVSANLMSLGAIDFGIVVDGSIVILEGIMVHLASRRKLNGPRERQEAVIQGAGKVVSSAGFATLIILIVFLPILALGGIEGKYFQPMAKTLVFCILGALILSMTYVPMMASLFLDPGKLINRSLADRFFCWLRGWYGRILAFCLSYARLTILGAFAVLVFSLLLFSRLGAEFIPTLDEGDLAMQMTLPAGSSLSTSIEISRQAERMLMDSFPEVRHVVAKIGTAEVPTDPMAVEDADVMIIMKPRSQWTSASSRTEMVERMKKALQNLEGAEFNFSQPIQLRFNELMTGAKADIAIKLYGEDMETLYGLARQSAELIRSVPGAGDVLVEQAMGLPQMVITFDRERISRYGLDIETLSTTLRAAYAGQSAGVVFENERRFDLVIRLDSESGKEMDLRKLFVRTREGVQIPLSQVASIRIEDGPLQINRDATRRRVVIGVNVRERDIQDVVSHIQRKLETGITLPPGYHFTYGGQFENLQNAIDTLTKAIPLALALILLLLFMAFRSMTYSLTVFLSVPLSLIGGVLALWIRGLPFSISAGVGFIALFGVAVLNGILMINHFRRLETSASHRPAISRILRTGCPELLRPVFLTGLVASLGFVPMAVATSAGAEIQRPLATVVIGGLAVSTILSLIIIPLAYKAVNMSAILGARRRRPKSARLLGLTVLAFLFLTAPVSGQNVMSLQQAISMSLNRHPRIQAYSAAVLRDRAQKGASWEIPSMEVDYSFGQINGPVKKDNELTVRQSIGNILTPFYQSALTGIRTEKDERYLELVRKEVRAEVRRSWSELLRSMELLRIEEELTEWAEKLSQSSLLRYNQGDITLAEKNIASVAASEARARLDRARLEVELSQSRLNLVTCSEEDVIPADSVLREFLVPDVRPAVSGARADYLGLLRKESAQAVRLERSRLMPEITMGFSLQKISPYRNLKAWTLGLSFPLVFNTYRSRIRQARAEQMITEFQVQEEERQTESRLREARLSLTQRHRQVTYYHDSALREAEELVQSARTQFLEGEISTIEMVESLAQVHTIRQGYIEAVHSYNISALELELYSDLEIQ